MKVTILGKGFAGLAAAWFLALQKIDVTVVDHSKERASQVAAGLLHPYAGKHSKPNFRGKEALKASKELLNIASDAHGGPVFDDQGILRIAITEQQRTDFLKAAQNKDVEWWDTERCQTFVPGLTAYPGIFIRSGLTVDCESYLKGLELACLGQRVKFAEDVVSSLDQLKQHWTADAYLLCAGAGLLQFPELAHIRLKGVKGQMVRIAWPKTLPPLRTALNSKVYLVMHRDQQSCWIGSTFERDYPSGKPDLAIATSELLPHAEQLLPALKDADILDCVAGVRLSKPDHIPLVEKLDEKTWIFSALGSKGLLYHALYGKECVEKLLEGL